MSQFLHFYVILSQQNMNGRNYSLSRKNRNYYSHQISVQQGCARLECEWCAAFSTLGGRYITIQIENKNSQCTTEIKQECATFRNFLVMSSSFAREGVAFIVDRHIHHLGLDRHSSRRRCTIGYPDLRLY